MKINRTKNANLLYKVLKKYMNKLWVNKLLIRT